MKLSTQVKSISYLKAHAAEMVSEARERGEPFVITQNGEAKAVFQDIESYEQTQETLAMLKILALGMRQIEEGRTIPADEAVRRVKERARSKQWNSRFG